MVIHQRDVWWASLRVPVGSEPGFRRPVVVVQGDVFNRTRLATIVVVPLTGNLRLAEIAGNVVVDGADAGLPRTSVANVSQITAINREQLDTWAGSVAPRTLDLIMAGLDLLLDRSVG